MRRWGKWLTIAALVALALCAAATVAAGVRQMRRDLAAVPTEVGQEQSAAARFRTAREQLRAVAKAQLNDVAHDGGADPELAAMAQRQLLRICEQEEQELTLEGVLALRGWEDCVVTVHDDSVNVLLRADDGITSRESAVIMELVCRETGAQSGNVKIIPIE